MKVKLYMKSGGYYMVDTDFGPIAFKNILLGKLLKQKAHKKFGVVFDYEFADGFKFRKSTKAIDDDEREPDLDEPGTKTSDPDQDYPDKQDPDEEPTRRGTYNEDEDSFPEQDEYRKEEPDNTQDEDTVPKKFKTDEENRKKSKKTKIRKKRKTKAEDNPDADEVEEHQEEKDPSEDSDNDPDTNPQRIVSENNLGLKGAFSQQAHRTPIEIKNRKLKALDIKNVGRGKDDRGNSENLVMARIKDIKTKIKLAPKEYQWVVVRCNCCGRDEKLPIYERKIYGDMLHRCQRCLGGR